MKKTLPERIDKSKSDLRCFQQELCLINSDFVCFESEGIDESELVLLDEFKKYQPQYERFLERQAKLKHEFSQEVRNKNLKEEVFEEWKIDFKNAKKAYKACCDSWDKCPKSCETEKD